MLNFIKNFCTDEDGAVTVDWVVLTAAIVALGLVVGQSVSGSATTAAGNIGADLIANSGGTTP